MFNPVEVARQTDAPQIRNELVFKTPWEARIFALIAHLADKQAFDWDSFRDELIVSVAQKDGEHDEYDHANGTPYYRAWLAAAERLFEKENYFSASELEQKIVELSDPHASGKLSPTGNLAQPIGQE